MKRKYLTLTIAVSLLLILFTSPAAALRENPGSCLLFPYYDHSKSSLTIVTIANVSSEPEWIRIVWIDGSDCYPKDWYIRLTGNDTFTFMSHALNPVSGTSGFIYAYVVKTYNSELEKDADVLIGQELVLSLWGDMMVHSSVNPVIFQCLNVQQDGKLRLDGKEYTAAPRKLYFPRFFGQGTFFRSRLVLINLTGGTYFDVEAHVICYNDNEYAFSAFMTFDCWEMMDLDDVSNFFTNKYLLSTNHDIGEPAGFSSFVETGMFNIEGAIAINPSPYVVIDNPSIYGVLIEGIGAMGYGTADLPMQIEDTSVFVNGMLWSTDPYGN